ncbi:MAG TPA: hypothetical protein VFW40_11070 [Capsulimonadaceae bacterium]|nr:hypothetical protein [Capsulimonadaceae bacterium]
MPNAIKSAIKRLFGIKEKTINPGPYPVIELAVEANDLKALLLGETPYAYRDRFSPAPGPSDLTSIYSGMLEYAQNNPDYPMKEKIEQLIPDLLASIEGIDSVATILLCEFLDQIDKRPNLGLNVDQLAQQLKTAIRESQDDLRNYKLLGGWCWPEGLLDDLRRVSGNLVEKGGPAS